MSDNGSETGAFLAGFIIGGLVGAATALILGGCQTNEQRIRDIVLEELSSAMKRTVIKEGAAIGPYSPAQQVGNFLFVSGQIAMNTATGGLDEAGVLRFIMEPGTPDPQWMD